jgi:ankyrin repeat protein
VSARAPDPGKEILRAVKQGDTARVRDLLAADPSLLEVKDAEENTLLHHAAWKGHAVVAAVLLEAGAPVDAQSRNGHWGGTPLHAAAHGNQAAVAALLIERGADLNARSCNDRTPVEETAFHNARAVANLLRKHGAGG